MICATWETEICVSQGIAAFALQVKVSVHVDVVEGMGNADVSQLGASFQKKLNALEV